MTTEAEFVERTIFAAIIHGQRLPDEEIYSEGRMACLNGLGFHECPYEFASVAGLSWRIGWNDYALANA